MKKSILFIVFITLTSIKCFGQRPIVGEIRLFAGNNPPPGWAFCEGQVLNKADNQRLFSVLRTAYGGDGSSTFALPDLRGRTPRGVGHRVSLGRRGGKDFQRLESSHMPLHTHTATVTQGSVKVPVNTVSGDNDEVSPIGGVLSNTADDLYTTSQPNAIYSGQAIPVEETSVNIIEAGERRPRPLETLDPYLGLHYIIFIDRAGI